MKCISLFKCNPQIEVIDKSHCSLEDVPNLQSYSRSLEELFLDSNKLTLLNENLFRLTKLRRFSFSDNNVSDIPANIAKLVNLVELDASKNSIYLIPEQIKFLRGLKYCDFSANDIEYLPQGFVNLKNLTILSLNYCQIKYLPEDIGSLKSLEWLELRENLLETVPDGISGLESLKKLDLGGNMLRELPNDIGSLKNLEYLLADSNYLETIPSSIGLLENLQCLDLTEQKDRLLSYLPEEISGLKSLTDLHLSLNSLEILPDGIRNLKNLVIFKVDNNLLNELNSNIGGCTNLQELVITSNRLDRLPESISYLLDLRTLNADSNLLRQLTSNISYLKKLCILSLRDNYLTTLPSEIGQLDSLSVLDVSGNRLQYLPTSIAGLNLKALWLAKNQAQPLPKLQLDELSNGLRILTCYLFPQQPDDDHPMQVDDNITQVNYDEHRRAAVSFDDAAVVDDELEDDNKFVRHNTPHPKELRQMHQFAKNELRGHDNATFKYNDTKKQQPINNDASNYESNGLPEATSRGSILSANTGTRSILKNSGLVAEEDRNLHDQDEDDHINDQDDDIIHSNYKEQTLRNQELFNVKPSIQNDALNPIDYDSYNSRGRNNADSKCQFMEIVVRRAKGQKPGLGLSIAGGKDTPPYKDGDEGIFVSKVSPNGSSEAAGVKVGDKILAVNNNIFYEGITHHKAVEIFRKIKPDSTQFTLKILRDPDFVISDDEESNGFKQIDTNGNSKYEPIKSPDFDIKPPTFSRTYTVPIQYPSKKDQELESEPIKTKSSVSTLSTGTSLLENSNMNKNIIYTTLVKDYKRDLGLLLENKPDESEMKSNWSNVVITEIKPNSIVSIDGKLQVGDRILTINGLDVSNVDLNRVIDLLEGTDRFIRIVVSRGESNDVVGDALKSMPTRPPLGSWFTSSANMSAEKSPVTGSYRRPFFGSVNSLQSSNYWQDPAKQMANSSAALPGISTSVLSNQKTNNVSHTKLVGLRSLNEDSSSKQPTSYAKDEKFSDVSKTSNSDEYSGQANEIDQRSAYRQAQFKSIEEDIEMARLISQQHREEAR